ESADGGTRDVGARFERESRARSAQHFPKLFAIEDGLAAGDARFGKTVGVENQRLTRSQGQALLGHATRDLAESQRQTRLNGDLLAVRVTSAAQRRRMGRHGHGRLSASWVEETQGHG